MTIEIPLKLPGANEYINACRRNRFAGAKMKSDVQSQIGAFISDLPVFDKPQRIHFLWIEGNKRRDLDNICFAKKFILDALVQNGKLKDDNRKFVAAFTDDFGYGVTHKVVMTFEDMEVEE